MKSTNKGIFQVVIDPDLEDNQMLVEEVTHLIETDPPDFSLWFLIKLKTSRLLHPLVHHWVPMKRFDEGSRRLIHTSYVTCVWCAKARPA